MGKNERLVLKRAHIEEQIEALQTGDDVVGKYKADMLDEPEEIKFQQWRLAVIDELFGKSEEAIRQEFVAIRQSGVRTVRERALTDLLKYALGEV